MNRVLITLCAICLVALSCQKELSGDYGIIPSGGGGVITGTWNFAGMTATYHAESTFKGGGIDMKTLSDSKYRSIQNTGTITFGSDGKAISNNLGYAVDTTVWEITYIDGILFDSSEIDFKIPYFSSSSTSNWKFKGADSVLFTNGSLAGSQDGAMAYSVSGNKMSLTSYQYFDTSFVELGATVKSKTTQTTIINLVR